MVKNNNFNNKSHNETLNFGVRGYLIITVITCLIFSILVYKINPYILWASIFMCFFHCCLFIVIWKIGYNVIYQITPLYILFVQIILLFYSLFFYHTSIFITMCWLMLVPYGASVLFSVRAGIWTTITGILFSCIVFFSISFLPNFFNLEINQDQLFVINIWTIISILVYMIYFAVFASLLSKKRIEEEIAKVVSEMKMQTKTEITKIENLQKEEKYDALYNKILVYFSKKQPYTDHNLTVPKLAIALNSNTTYIQRALVQNGEHNFNAFVNKYRIQMVKDMLDRGDAQKYTIHHIYSSAGFKLQSTFNIAFKHLEGITPSEYNTLSPEEKERMKK